jgi:hypothetical protein
LPATRRRSFLALLRRIALVRAGGQRRKHEYWDQHPCKH